jgi:hypothetical protein
MVQQPSIPHDLPTDFNHHVVLFPTRSAREASDYAADFLARPAGGPNTRATSRMARIRTRTIREVVVIDVGCELEDVVEELDRAIQEALAEGPRGVVCDLSDLPEAEASAVEILATAGRHVRDWPGIPVAVACRDPRLREALRAHPLGGHLIVTASLFSAVSAVLATASLSVQSRRLAPHPTAPRAAREFVTRTLLDWRLGQVIPFASLVVSELVASSTVDAGTAIDLSVVWDQGAIRLNVRDHGPGLPDQESPAVTLQGRRLTVVAGLARAFGVLPTADGGKVVWAVLDAPRPPPWSSPHGSAAARQEALIMNDAHGLTGVPAEADLRVGRRPRGTGATRR